MGSLFGKTETVKRMKVPKYIKKKMHNVARLSNLADREMQDVEEWLEKNGIDVSFENGIRDGSGCSLEELEYGNDITDELCERIERENK